MNIHGPKWMAGVAFVLAFSPFAAAQAPEKPPELKVLERFIGKWKFELLSRQAEWTPKEVRYSGTSTNEWVLDGWFQHHKVKYDQEAVERVDIMTYDIRKKTYRAWSYDSHGFANEMTGAWDEKTKTLTTKGELADGVTAVSAMRFIDSDNREATFRATDAAGKIYVDIRGKLTRQK